MAEKKKMLTAEDILTACDVKEEEVFVKEWGGNIKVKSLTVDQMQRIRKDAMLDGVYDEEKFTMLLFTEGVSEPKFTEDQRIQLKEKSMASFGKVMVAIQKISGIESEEVTEASKLFRS